MGLFSRLSKNKLGMSKPNARTFIITIEALSLQSAVDLLHSVNSHHLRYENHMNSSDARLTICTQQSIDVGEPEERIINGKICNVYQSKLNLEKE